MQKKQFVIKGLLFGLFSIIGFSSSAFAATACETACGADFACKSKCITDANLAGVSNTSSKSTTQAAGNGLGTTKPVWVTVTAPGPKIPTTLNLPVDPCLTKSQSDGRNATAGLAACKERYKDNPTNLAACDTQYNEQTKMILATYESCLANKNTNTDESESTWYTSSMWITMNPECLANGQCGFDIYKLLGINKSSSATLFVQDILLSATFFIGTVITIALLYSGIMFIMAGATGKDPSNAKNGIKYSIIGLLIVVTSYSLIRLIQYIAKGL